MIAPEPIGTCASCGRRRPAEDLIAVDGQLLCEPCQAESAKAEQRRDSIDAAWKSVEATLPKGWAITSLGRELDEVQWVAMAEGPGAILVGELGPTPARALRALAAKLAEES